MKLLRAAALAAAFALPPLAATAQAAELKVVASTALKAVFEELAPQYEKASGNKLDLAFDSSANVKTQIEQGKAFDVAVLTRPLNEALASAGKIDPASRTVIARAGSGVCVRAGTLKPDVGTPDALKRTLLAAKSIGFNGVGASRAGNEAMLAKLGIADAVKPKIKLLTGSAPLSVASGEVEIGLGPISECYPVAGAQVAGPYPAELQSYLVFSAAVSSGSANADAAKSLIKFLGSPAAAAAYKKNGMEPG